MTEDQRPTRHEQLSHLEFHDQAKGLKVLQDGYSIDAPPSLQVYFYAPVDDDDCREVSFYIGRHERHMLAEELEGLAKIISDDIHRTEWKEEIKKAGERL